MGPDTRGPGDPGAREPWDPWARAPGARESGGHDALWPGSPGARVPGCPGAGRPGIPLNCILKVLSIRPGVVVHSAFMVRSWPGFYEKQIGPELSLESLRRGRETHLYAAF